MLSPIVSQDPVRVSDLVARDAVRCANPYSGLYFVRVAPQWDLTVRLGPPATCECADFLATGKPCAHIAAVQQYASRQPNAVRFVVAEQPIPFLVLSLNDRVISKAVDKLATASADANAKPYRREQIRYAVAEWLADAVTALDSQFVDLCTYGDHNLNRGKTLDDYLPENREV